MIVFIIAINVYFYYITFYKYSVSPTSTEKDWEFEIDVTRAMRVLASTAFNNHWEINAYEFWQQQINNTNKKSESYAKDTLIEAWKRSQSLINDSTNSPDAKAIEECADGYLNAALSFLSR